MNPKLGHGLNDVVKVGRGFGSVACIENAKRGGFEAANSINHTRNRYAEGVVHFTHANDRCASVTMGGTCVS